MSDSAPWTEPTYQSSAVEAETMTEPPNSCRARVHQHSMKRRLRFGLETAHQLTDVWKSQSFHQHRHKYLLLSHHLTDCSENKWIISVESTCLVIQHWLLEVDGWRVNHVVVSSPPTFILLMWSLSGWSSLLQPPVNQNDGDLWSCDIISH